MALSDGGDRGAVAAATAGDAPSTADVTSAVEQRRVDVVATPRLTWRACRDRAPRAECATVKLPLDYDAAAGGDGRETPVSAYLEPEGDDRGIDDGNYKFYVGPVRNTIDGQCIRWVGSVDDVSFDSPPEHCQ